MKINLPHHCNEFDIWRGFVNFQSNLKKELIKLFSLAKKRREKKNDLHESRERDRTGDVWLYEMLILALTQKWVFEGQWNCCHVCVCMCVSFNIMFFSPSMLVGSFTLEHFVAQSFIRSIWLENLWWLNVFDKAHLAHNRNTACVCVCMSIKNIYLTLNQTN